MGTALQKAISLILSSDAELLNILKVTAQMSLKSSLLALLLGVPLGICLGNSKFPGGGLLIIPEPNAYGDAPCGMRPTVLHPFLRGRPSATHEAAVHG